MTTIVRDGVLRSPSGLKVKGQSYATLEATADMLRRGLPLVAGEKYKLDCVAIFERSLPAAGYDYRTVGIDEVDECAAFTIPEEKVVVLREDIYDKLHSGQAYGRSTVVHELSHIALRHHVTLYRGATTGQHGFYEDSEWQAKALTAAIMMPEAAARIARSPDQLAEMCGTSEEAAGYRIKTLVRLKLLRPTHSLWEFGSQ